MNVFSPLAQSFLDAEGVTSRYHTKMNPDDRLRYAQVMVAINHHMTVIECCINVARTLNDGEEKGVCKCYCGSLEGLTFGCMIVLCQSCELRILPPSIF